MEERKNQRFLSNSYWFIKNMLRHAKATSVPQDWNFENYEYYWERRIKEGSSQNISYPEIINIAEKIIEPGSQVLDIGCGNGAFLSAMKEKMAIRETGIDVSSLAVEIAKKRGINSRTFDVFKDQFELLGDFQYVTCFEVLEHIQNSEYLMQLILKEFPRAEFIFSIPNSGYIYARWRFLLGRFPKQWHVHPGEHIRFWTMKDFSFVLEQLGYRIIEVYPADFPFFLSRKVPGWFSNSLVFHLAKS